MKWIPVLVPIGAGTVEDDPVPVQRQPPPLAEQRRLGPRDRKPGMIPWSQLKMMLCNIRFPQKITCLCVSFINAN
jgi:hypothetical protein